jgi:ribulose-phosphate 3-epimerase
MKKDVKVAPSILSANFANLESDVKKVEKVADYIHLDVMDGHFVPNLTFGMGVGRALRKVVDLPLDSHLMIERPEDFVDDFCEFSDIVTVHYETSNHLHRLIQRIKEKDVKAFVALNPHTPVECLKEIIMDIDGVLIMSVNPGFGGQKFIPNAVNKIRELDEYRKNRGLTFEIEVDGGINLETYIPVLKAGANILVAGSYIFKSENPAQAVEKLKSF